MADTPWLVETLPDGTKEFLHYDESADTFAIERVGDVEAAIKYCHERQTDGWNGYGKSREWRHLGTVPDIIALKWMNEAGLKPDQLKGKEFTNFIVRKLKDPDWQAFRTVSGRI